MREEHKEKEKILNQFGFVTERSITYVIYLIRKLSTKSTKDYLAHIFLLTEKY